ncbi:hypothetical protein JOF41_001922 [Saccharothrix coeruleofusca]|uniref:hypothetical protein n=1 Tax=Saccharothrix coeruleofusca TaxID=33919 RepID=UPI001AE41892|nr:hypothetical protein [Saccharothrix coeruleofusca]MBP2335744.1 hypothetical protein [Saccharothrix coeruleofusca]
MEMRQLLWRLGDRFVDDPKPAWFDHAGDLVVVRGEVVWETPDVTDGAVYHELPAGTYPVYVGTNASPGDDWNPDTFRYDVRAVVIPLAEPGRIAEADWDVEDYGGGFQFVEDYAVLWDGQAMRAPSLTGAASSFFEDARDAIAARGPHFRRDNWATVVLDEETGANAFVFPVSGESVNGYEILDEDENVLCLVLTTYE